MTDRITFEVSPPDWVRLPVCAWLRRHGVDPDMVAVPGWIERQPELCRLAWEGYVPDPEHRIRLNEARDGASRVAAFVQLEGPPLPWPPELLSWLDLYAA